MSGSYVALVSDIHGNEEAFRTVLAYLRGLSITQIYCLGDLVGYGQGARACVEMAQRHNVFCIQGNHDAQVVPPRDPRMREEAVVALDHARRDLLRSQVLWLAGLQSERVLGKTAVMVHGSLRHRDEYILNKEHLQQNLQRLVSRDLRLGFFGHTHVPLVAGGGKVRLRFDESEIVRLDPQQPYLVNPGSVGQPRDGVPEASFILYDAGAHEIMFIRIEYDIATEQERMRAAGLPDSLWKRLSLGR